MSEPADRKPTQSAVLLLGILLTLLAVVGHRFLPERRLSIDSSRKDANFFPVESGNGAQAAFHWIDQPRFHYACEFPQAPVGQGCGFAFMLAPWNDASHGTDLSGFHTM